VASQRGRGQKGLTGIFPARCKRIYLASGELGKEGFVGRGRELKVSDSGGQQAFWIVEKIISLRLAWETRSATFLEGKEGGSRGDRIANKCGVTRKERGICSAGCWKEGAKTERE